MKTAIAILVFLGSLSCGSGSPISADASSDIASSPSVSTVDDGTCLKAAENAACRGNVYFEGTLKTPSNIGLAVGGRCHGGICCLGCWDGSKCQYFNDENCSGPSTEPANGLTCFGRCSPGTTCQLVGDSTLPLYFFSCQR